MRKIIVLVYLVLQSCGSYTLTTNTGYEIKSILAITEVGDTISVPYRQFVKYRDTQFIRYQHNNNWYWNNWRYNDPIFWSRYNWSNPRLWNEFRDYNNRYITPNRPYVRPKVKPKTRPRPRPRTPIRPRVVPKNPPRRVNPPTRRVTPRRATPTRSGNNTRSSIKQ